MFNKDFYPTPVSLIEKMWDKIDKEYINNILEPSAGKGDIVDFILEQPKKRRKNKHSVDCIEKDSQLQSLLRGKNLKLVHDDFLTFNSNKYYDVIMMNPPFSEGVKHLLKALRMIENGGQVVCLLNAKTLKNDYSKDRQYLSIRLEEMNADISFIEEAFSNAERKTNVETALIYVDVEKKDNDKSLIFNSLQKAKEQNHFKPVSENGLVHSDINIQFVEMFNYESQVGKQLLSEYEKLLPYMQSSFNKEGYNHPILSLGLYGGDNRYKDNAPNFNDYLKELRLKYWKLFFNSDSITKLCTNKLRTEFNNQIDELGDYDFTLFNIKSVSNMLNDSLGGSIEQAILGLFDKFTVQSCYDGEFSKNIHYYNGWKTNKAFYINKKVIIRVYGQIGDWGIREALQDIELAYQYLDKDKDKKEILPLGKILKNAEKMGISKKIETTYFYLDFYKKGTCHITFKDPDLLFRFNVFGSQKKGWLPYSYGKKEYSSLNPEEKSTIDSFHDIAKIAKYEDVLNDKKRYLYDKSSTLLIEA